MGNSGGGAAPLTPPPPPQPPGQVRLHFLDSDKNGGTRLRGRNSRVGFRPFPPSRSTQLKFNWVLRAVPNLNFNSPVLETAVF